MREVALFLFTVFWFALVGPLVGGAPWNILIVTIPFSYVFGIVPAVVAGVLYGLLLIYDSRTNASVKNEFVRGAVCGAVSTLACLVAYIAAVPDGPGLFNPARALRTDYLPGTPGFLIVLLAAMPLVWAATICSLGAVAGGVCARYFPRRVLRNLSANKAMQAALGGTDRIDESLGLKEGSHGSRAEV